MLKEMPLLRAPENKRTGIEIRPKVKCPDQTEAAIVPSRERSHIAINAVTLPPKQSLCHQRGHFVIKAVALSS
jgi:hypothetical protein